MKTTDHSSDVCICFLTMISHEDGVIVTAEMGLFCLNEVGFTLPVDGGKERFVFFCFFFNMFHFKLFL